MGGDRKQIRRPGNGVGEREPKRIVTPATITNRTLAAAVQAKLEVGAAGDRYEREADRVAREVVATARTTRPREIEGEAVHMLPLRRQELDEDELQLDRDARPGSHRVVGAAGGGLDQATEAAIDRARSGGRALDPGLQREMGASIGADFSGVKVHTGPDADGLNGSLGARAFTTGSDIFVRSADYRPRSREGRELIAHELTHVVQQGAAPVIGDHPIEDDTTR